MKPWISAFIHSNFSSYAQILQNLSRCYIGIYFPFSRHLCTDFQSQVLSLELLFLRNYIICNSRLLVLSCMHCVSYFEQHFFKILFHKTCCNQIFYTGSWTGVQHNTTIPQKKVCEIYCRVYSGRFVRLSEFTHNFPQTCFVCYEGWSYLIAIRVA